MIATFIGSHLGIENNKLSLLQKLILNLINNGFDTFLCGEYGDFDKQVNNILFEIKNIKRLKIKIILIKPYYQYNKFENHKAQTDYIKNKKEIMQDTFPGNLQQEIAKFEHNYENECYNMRYLYETKYFDEIIVCELDNIPHKLRIIECNKWKVRQCDAIIAFCPKENSNSWKIKEYAKHLKKLVYELK